MIRPLALLLALAPVPLGAPAAAQTAPAAARVEIPFAPPLDTVLRFRITNSETVTGTPTESYSWIEEMRFVRSSDGFILHWRMDAASFPPEMRDPALAPMVAPFIGTPIAFDLDSDGSPVRVRDWDALLPKMLAIVDQAIALASAGKDQAATPQITAQVRAMFTGMTAESATAMLLKNIAPVLHWGGLTLEAGKASVTSGEQPVPLIGGSILQHITTRLTALDPGKTATIQIHTENDAKSFAALMARAMERFGPAGDPKTRAELAGAMALFGQLQMTDESIAVIDLATGLPRSFDHSRRAYIEDRGKVETLRIEWL